MADLSNLTYSSLQNAVTDWLARGDLTSNIPDFIMLFENEVNRTLRTRQMEVVTLLYPESSTSFAIDNATNNGSGLIRLSFTTTSTSTGPATGTEVVVTNVVGTAEANNVWIATNISSISIDLQQSSFVNAYTSGGSVSTPSGQAALPSDYIAWRRATWTGSPNKVLEYVQPDILRRYHPIFGAPDQNFDVAFPTMFTIEGNNVIFRPIDPAAVEFDYYQKIPALASQSSSTNWLLTAFPDCYLAGAMTEAYVFQKDWDQAGMWKQRRDDILGRLTAFDQKTRGPSYIRPDMAGIIP